MRPNVAEQADTSAAPLPSFHDLLLSALPSLRQQALALTRHRADAEDLVQAAVTNALAAQHSFEPGTNFRAWMTRIMRNRFFSNFRRRRETVDIEDAPSSLLGRSGGQEENIAFKELRANLARLPSDQRLVLMMISVQGLSYEEASEQLGVAVGTLKCRVFRARKQLKIWMLGEDEEAPVSKPSAKRQVRQAATRTKVSTPPNYAGDGARLS
ncbi:sigma-70 family RNA polymerase sigma factor [Roseococcus pinisoli]|uniref:Sigma-70 family RNA polymerase sigma factor n=1 Tax=Roseococcus pinisoli TaxID=2835040 RepID=A0ABS5QA45_9PROT|nr:sigma-70 family RNA polymerase sigma factor [Roseococcus pinisoli]MBS7810373.1 sigma-70 family RNA polymerase sigma factor [Roseococcus pinisoli]